MIYQLDKSVGEIVQALRDRNMLDDSVVIFYSDNGGPTYQTYASNYPLRGQKISGLEGGTRVNAIIYDKSLPKNIIRNRMFHPVDFLPTLKTLTGARFKISTKIDGIDQALMLRFNLNLRNEVTVIDDVNGYSSYVYKNFKIVNGSVYPERYLDGWLGTNNNADIVDAKTYFENVKESTTGNWHILSFICYRFQFLYKKVVLSIHSVKILYLELNIVKFKTALFILLQVPLLIHRNRKMYNNKHK